jgi:predicted transcriptional regulator
VDEQSTPPSDKLVLVSNIVSSYLRQNSIGIDQIANVVGNVTRAMQDAESVLSGSDASGGRAGQEAAIETFEPAVSVRSSVKQDHLICLQCGTKVKTLRRHLMSAHGIDPRAYRERFGLKKEYPLVAPEYSAKRSEMAKTLGLGRKAGKPTPRRRPKKAAAAA